MPDRLRVLGVVVLYDPPPELPETIAGALAETDGLYLWDNRERPPGSAGNDPLEAIPELGAPGVLRDGGSGNVGLALAYRAALARARSEGFDAIFLLDEDSRPVPGARERLESVLRELEARGPVGGVNARNLESVHAPGSPKNALARLAEGIYEREYRSGRLHRDLHARERLLLTNSGFLARVGALDAVGGYPDELRVDAVDYDLAFRLRAAGYRLFEVPEAQIHHRMGRAMEVRVGPATLHTRGYGPRRTYLLVRDTTWCARRNWRRGRALSLAILGSMWIGTLGALLLLPERGARVRAVLDGLRDAGRYRGGVRASVRGARAPP